MKFGDDPQVSFRYNIYKFYGFSWNVGFNNIENIVIGIVYTLRMLLKNIFYVAVFSDKLFTEYFAIRQHLQQDDS